MLNCRSSQELAEHSSRRSCHLCGADIPLDGPSRCARCARWTGSWDSELPAEDEDEPITPPDKRRPIHWGVRG